MGFVKQLRKLRVVENFSSEQIDGGHTGKGRKNFGE